MKLPLLVLTKFRGRLLALGLGLLTAGWVAPIAAGDPPPVRRAPGVQPGELAPDFTVLGPGGEEVKLTDYRGKIVLLDFWATWCAPCLAAMPHHDELLARFAADGLVVLAVCVADTREKYDAWVEQHGETYGFITAHDPTGRNMRESPLARQYGISMLPTMYVIDREGRVVGRAGGGGHGENPAVMRLLAAAGLPVTAATPPAAQTPLLPLVAPTPASPPVVAPAAETVPPPPPPFRETYGRLKSGEALPPAVVELRDGTVTTIAELTAGEPAVITIWKAGQGPGSEVEEFLGSWSRRYTGRNVRFIGLVAYDGREQFHTWYDAQSEPISFPVVFDPAGAVPPPPRPTADLDDEELAAFRATTRAHYAKVIPMVWAGGAMAPVPHTLVVDGNGVFLGLFQALAPQPAEALANLLLRAGVALDPADQPAHVFTDAETAPPVPLPPVERRAVGEMAPDFVTHDLAGREVKLSDHRGSVVVLDFWATWCGPCMVAMPHTQQVAAQYRDQGVVVLGSATNDTRVAFERWVQVNQAKYPDIIWSHDAAERGPNRASRALYGVTGIPTQFIIDREGRIAEIVVGYLRGEVLLDAALAKAGVAVDETVLEQAQQDLRRRARQ
jgi:thiol-disulfide isomerase/thioredoxin